MASSCVVSAGGARHTCSGPPSPGPESPGTTTPPPPTSRGKPAPEPQSPEWGGGRVGGGGAQGTLVQCTPWKRQLKTPLKAEVTLPLL